VSVEIRKPKAEGRLLTTGLRTTGLRENSDFGTRACFGFRISDFGVSMRQQGFSSKTGYSNSLGPVFTGVVFSGGFGFFGFVPRSV
jgi:hypothetical protein